MTSLINAIQNAPVQAYPFPHIEIENALPTEAYATLAAGYPDLQTFVEGKPYQENFRYNLFASQLISGPFPDSVREFAQQHSSYAFYATILNKFKDYYTAILGEDKFRELLNPERVGLRKRNTFYEADVLLDSTFAINTPNETGQTTVRGPHIDKLFKLYAGLYYLRKPEDTSRGGDLILYRYKNRRYAISENDASSTCGGARMEIDRQDVEESKTVPYTANKLILYPNSIEAVHGVSVRSRAEVERRLITFVADYKTDILDVTQS
jgi:hypothetical protein